MILYLCHRAACPSQVEQDSRHTSEWLVVAPLDGLLPDRYYCCRDCAIQDMASYEIPETMPHG
jgi:hypothetical protein